MRYTIERYPTRWIDVWHLPDGRTLVRNGRFEIAPGEHLLLRGPSGSRLGLSLHSRKTI